MKKRAYVTRPTKITLSGYCKLTAQSMVDSVLPYFDLSVQLAGVQYEYNHKQTVYGNSTIRNI